MMQVSTGGVRMSQDKNYSLNRFWIRFRHHIGEYFGYNDYANYITGWWEAHHDGEDTGEYHLLSPQEFQHDRFDSSYIEAIYRHY